MDTSEITDETGPDECRLNHYKQIWRSAIHKSSNEHIIKYLMEMPRRFLNIIHQCK